MIRCFFCRELVKRKGVRFCDHVTICGRCDKLSLSDEREKMLEQHAINCPKMDAAIRAINERISMMYKKEFLK